VSYTLILIPFIFIGFLVVYLFALSPKQMHKLYFIDLLGAGLGAYLFFPLIISFEVFHTIYALAFISLIISLRYFFNRQKFLVTAISIIIGVICFVGIEEPKDYVVDPAKGWEWIPGFEDKNDYLTLARQWHPLGRTDVYRILNENLRFDMYYDNVTFMVNLMPPPEFSYFTSDFLAGTPVFNFAEEGLDRAHSKLNVFSQPIEVPYTIVRNPRTLIIGTGGGRDIFIAKSHGASEIYGAEINPATYQMMAPGGLMHDYSGRVYSGENTHIKNVDGRHLVRTSKKNSFDLIILNGVDTFSGLSTGAYAYSEGYLYTKNAVVDYLTILKDTGIVNFNRHLFPNAPRETLRLTAIALEALEEIGALEPWDHIYVGGYKGWSIVLIKKTPFTMGERKTIESYFMKHRTQLVYPADKKTVTSGKVDYFGQYVAAFKQGRHKEFAANYKFDISVITDDNPFFYKHYKFKNFDLRKYYRIHHSGTIIFMTQIMVFLHALMFILLFIFFPLFIFKRNQVSRMPFKSMITFITYFSCLGVGFMFIEIPVMQRFALFLGSPIYSISITLAVLLISSGIGSLFISVLRQWNKHYHLYIGIVLIIGIIIFNNFWNVFYNQFIAYSFVQRVWLTVIFLFPLGFCLGIFFPSGLLKIKEDQKEIIAWAWGLNCGFSVLGSILSVILAQFVGFQFVIYCACAIYILAIFTYQKLNF